MIKFDSPEEKSRSFQVHPKTSIEDLEELSSLLQVPLVVSMQNTGKYQ